MPCVESGPPPERFDATAEALVDPVNCVGVMGKGLALEQPSTGRATPSPSP